MAGDGQCVCVPRTALLQHIPKVGLSGVSSTQKNGHILPRVRNLPSNMAGTALSRQLRQIALATGPTAADVVTKSSGKRGALIRPSLIFEAKEAADVDAETILHMAQAAPYSSIAPLSFTRCAQPVSPCARAGLAELVAMDARFKPFLTTLFSPASLQTDRDDEPPDVVAALDRSIDAFLMLLSDALLLPPSHKALEYLIRKYRCAHQRPLLFPDRAPSMLVQQCNVDSLVLAALPYHETSLFVRIVQLLSLKHSKWAPVLHGCKANGAAIPRAQLVQRCVKDDSFFHAMCHAVCLLQCHVPCGMPPPIPCAMRYASSNATCHAVCLLMPCAMRYASSCHVPCGMPPHAMCHAAEKAATCVVRDGPASASPPTAPAPPAMRLLTFTSVLLLEALAGMRVSVDTLSHLLPFILNGLQPSALHEHRLAAMMLVSQLANRSQLSTQVVNSLLVALLSPTPAAAPTARGVRAPPTAISMDAFLVVVHLSATQRVLSLPSRAVSNILTDKHFVDVLSGAAHKFNTAKILHLLVDALLPKIATSQAAADVLLAMLRQLPRAALSPLVPRLALSLLRFAIGKGLPQGPPVVLSSLRQFHTSNSTAPVLFSFCHSAFLCSDFLKSSIAIPSRSALCTPRTPTLSEPRIQPLLLALSLKFTSPTDAAIAAVLEWQVRKAAVEQLPALMAAAGKHMDTDEAAQGEVQSFVSSALQRRLADDSWEVLHAAVTSPLLPRALSASLLVAPLKAILLRPLPPTSEPLPAHIKECQSTALHLLRTALLLLALLGAAHSLPATSASLESALQSRGNVSVAGSMELQEAKEGGVMDFAEEAVGLVQDAWKGVVAQAVQGSGGEGEKRRKGAASVHLDALLSSLAQAAFSAAPDVHAKIFTLLSTLPASSVDSLSLSADLTISCLSSLLRKLPGATRISDSVSGPRQQRGVVAGRVFELLMGTASPRAAALAAARIAGAVQRRAERQGGKSDGEGGGRVELQEAMLQAVRDMGLHAGEMAGGEEGSTGQQGIASLLQLLLAGFATRASLLTFLDPFLLPSPSGSSHSPSLQLAALSLLPAVAAAAVPGDAKANEELPHVLVGLLLRLMVAVQSPHKPVRKAALHAFATLTQATATLPSSNSTLPSPASLSLLASAFSSAKDVLLSDPSLPFALSFSSTVALSPAFASAASSTSIPSKPGQAAALLIRLLDPSFAGSTGSSLTPSDRTVLLSALFNAALSLPPWPQALALYMLASIPAATALLPLGQLLPRLHELLSRRLHCHLQQAQSAAGLPLPHKPASVDGEARSGGRLELDEVHLLAVGLQLVAAAASGGGQGGAQAEADVDEEMREEGGEGEERAKDGEEKAQHTAGKGVSAVDVAPLLFMAMQVQGAISADDVAVEAPSITAAGVVTNDFLEALPDNHQDGLVASLLFLMAASEASPAARQAAKEALRRLKLSPTMLARLITALFSPPSVSHGTPQSTRSNKPDMGAYVPLSDSLPVERRVAAATALLEMLLWKEDVTAQQTSVLSHCWPMLPAPNSTDAEGEGGEQGGHQAEDGEGDAAGSEVAMSAQMLGAVEFVLQLVLTVARNALSSHTHVQEGQDEEMESEGEEDEEGMEHGEEECVVHMVGAAVEVVKGRRDPATASAAIAVLAAAAERQPEEVVEHVVAVLSVATTTTLALDIRESHDAIHRLVEAVLPAWLHHNQDVTPLLQMVVSSLPSMLHLHRIALLSALLRGVSPSLGLAPLLLLLLTTTGVTPSLLTAHAENSKDTPRSARARRQAALQQHAYWRRRGDSTGDEKLGEWGLSLAFELCSQVPGSIRLEAYVKLLEATCPPIIARRKASAAADEACGWWSGTGPDDDVVVVSFVGAELPAAVAAMEEDVGMEGGADAAEGAEGGLNNEGAAAMVARDTQHRQLFVSLLEHVVLRLRATAAAAAAAGAVASPIAAPSYPPALKDRADLVASAAYELLQILDSVTPSGVFLQAVQTLLTNPSTHIRCKVLRLLAARVRASVAHTLMPHSRGKARSKQRLAQAAQEEAREYASVAGQLAHMGALEGADRSLATQMAALQTLDAIIKRFASLASDDFSSALTPLIRIISAHSSPPLLTAAALHCLSSLASSLHHLLLPHLPVLMPPLFASADRALAAAGNGTVEETKADEGDREVGDEQMEEEGGGHGRSEVVSEGVAHDLLAAVLQALEAMLAAMGPLLSPFTPRILACTCFSPVLLCCPSASVLQHAHAVRQLLIQKLPMRLLLDPLVSSWTTATAAGPAPSAALLHMLARAASHMDRAAASTFHARIFDFLLLRTFDVRRAPPFPPSTDSSSNQRLPGGMQMVTAPDVEGASVAAMVGLVMKTSESVFKPMFVRVLEWAASEYAADGDAISPAGRVERHLTLFGLVNVLSDKLRSVFVPYFQYLFDIAIRHLVGTADAAKGGIKKKRRKSASVAATAEDSIAQWQLRHLVVCALHKCFLYDSNAAFLDATRFQALLEPLVSQIDREPPAGVASIVSAPSAPEAHSVASQLSEAHLMLEPYIAASVPSISAVDDELVTCLGEMTIAGGSDILWKQLNHQVLMCTRSERVRSRQLSLRVVNEIVDRVHEEYVVLLPESIPFLAELLEDPDANVAESAKSLVKKLEELSGEELTQYF
ncbi:unnamed protein product [Closterium sp. Yama58-4]|nr:unnamed protein product [Closterium sp. Yama58-4]